MFRLGRLAEGSLPAQTFFSPCFAPADTAPLRDFWSNQAQH